ncbi:MAG: phosphate ABC transporter substrate-binding protein PstS family protein [Clostridiales bacterium]|jgi:phosphate transport system substrate-binding protein|nr:phosphate ABC transporter substrate-binding protein PstS family protein [Clostridiales bacterium]
MKKLLSVILSLVMLAGIFTGCSKEIVPTATPESTPAVSGNISIAGSSALNFLAIVSAGQIKMIYPGVLASAVSSSSGEGLSNVCEGTIDIGNSDVYAEEMLTPDDADKHVDHKICVVGISVIVNEDVGTYVKNLTKDQLKNIFTGQITNWNEVGGPDEVITLINRSSSSGTRALFTKWALEGQNIVENAQSIQAENSLSLLTGVNNTTGAIGYLALSYILDQSPDTEKINKVQIDGVDATYENIYSNKYQVWGYEHMYTKGEPNAQTKAFLDYMVLMDGIQETSSPSQLETMGFGLISKLSPEAAASR